MNKTYWTYLLMLAIFAGGLWAILRLGSGLRAAPNVAGEWQIRWTDAGAGEALPERIIIDQSGRYLTATINRPTAPVRLSGRIDSESSAVALRDSRRSWNLSARLDDNQILTGTLDTPARHPLQAWRVSKP